MAKTLGGAMFVKDGVKYDYCFQESISCLCDLCDEVSVVGIESEDDTIELLHDLARKRKNLSLIIVAAEEWEKQKGKEKLAYFQNLAASCLGTDWYFLLQADEVLTEGSFKYIRRAIEDHRQESFLCKRVNLWGDCGHYINVPINKQPCSIVVNRLAKAGKKSHGDGESIEARASLEFINNITIMHYGFVRKREVMKSKIINMQEGVFQIDHDPKLDQGDIFDSSLWFKGSELSPINSLFKHPKWISEWIKTRP